MLPYHYKSLGLLGVIASSIIYKEGWNNAFTINFTLCIIGYFIMCYMIPKCQQLFIKCNLKGKDILKKEQPLLAESMGLLGAVVYLVIIYLFMPFQSILDITGSSSTIQFNQFLSGLLSIQAMTLLGFADDVFDIRWRHKVLLPLVAAVPLLMVYYLSGGITSIVIPFPIDKIIGKIIDLRFIYYIYMALIPIYCTNAINILAGINGVEVGQNIILCISLILFNITQLDNVYPQMIIKNEFSLFMLIPLLTISLALFKFNFYPAKVFVGDTYCYFSGMVYAVVGILGHFSKSLLLFFMPQIFNFLLSVPQLFHIIPCPRHRMPKLDNESGLLTPSYVELSEIKLKQYQIIIINILERTGLIKVIRKQKLKYHNYHSITNLTLLNSTLVIFGPMKEDKLCIYIMIIQVVWSIIAFTIRLKIAKLFYN